MATFGLLRNQKLPSLALSLSSGQRHQKVIFQSDLISPPEQGTINWQASSDPDFIQNYFLSKRMFDFFDNRDKCRVCTSSDPGSQDRAINGTLRCPNASQARHVLWHELSIVVSSGGGRL